MKLDPQKTIFLIDGSSFLYRAYYSLRPLHAPEGKPVQAVFGFCRMIKKLIDTFHPAYIALVWDSKGKTTRHDMYPEYKSTRQAPPSDLFEQKELIIEFADLIGMRQVAQQGIEADDLMYSLAKDLAVDGDQAVFITSDKDMGQALTEHIISFDPFKYELVDVAAFEKKIGFPLSQYPFYYALLGDTSDNIPGVKGVGKKTAEDLVKQFASLEDLYAHLHEIKKAGVKNALLTHKKEAFLSRDLFLLQYHKLGLTKKDLAFDEKNWVEARPLFERLNFKSMLKEMGESAEVRIATIDDKIAFWKTQGFITVTTQEQLQKLCDLLKSKKIFACDTETNGLEPLQSDLVGISLCVEEGSAYYVPCGHITGAQLTRDEVVQAFKPILEDPEYKKYMHHAKFDELVFCHAGIEVRGMVFDTMIAGHLVIKDWQSAGLKNLSSFFFGQEMLTFAEVVKHFKYKNFSQVPLDLATLYAAADAAQTFKLVQLLRDKLREEEINGLYEKIEYPLIQVLYEMEKKGILVDAGMLAQLNESVTRALMVIEQEIMKIIGDKEPINLNSPKQIEQLLFYKLQLPPQKKSAKGTSYSTDQEVLVELAKLHPVPALIVKYRELFKLKTTYIEALPEFINPQSKRIHTSFSQTNVATGRLSSSDPNLQNIPAGGAGGYGIQVRAAFKPEPGHIFISADYSQIELRILAYLSQDSHLMDAFLKGHDIHAQTAAHLFDVKLADVSSEQRQVGKRINFSILYGLTPFGLSKDLDIPYKEAKHYIEKYFNQYPKVSEWMDQIIAFAKEHGYVKTFWGRRRYVPAIHEKNRSLYEEACRVAINTVAQGTAAEIMKVGMISLDKEIKAQKIDAHMLLQIHDELIISCNREQREMIDKIVIEKLESVVTWNVPLVVKTRMGNDWKEITK